MSPESTRPQDPRRATGNAGEGYARGHLRRAGYAVVETNFRTRFGELDIIAARDGCLVFCEVKTLVAGNVRGPAAPLDAIGPAKRRRLRLMARQWLAGRSGSGRPQAAELRFDAIGVVLGRSGELLRLEHVEGAF